MSETVPDLPDLSDIIRVLDKIPGDIDERATLFCDQLSIHGDEAAEIMIAGKNFADTLEHVKKMCQQAEKTRGVEEHLRVVTETDKIHRAKDKFMSLIAKAESTHSLKH